jgi:hypothetical protein
MAIDLRQIGNELSLRYAIEQSVQQATLGLPIKENERIQKGSGT